MSPKIDRSKFVILAEKRVNKAIKDIKLIGNLSNKRNYSYTEDDAEQIFKVLKKYLDDMKARFDSKNSKEDEIFRLQ